MGEKLGNGGASGPNFEPIFTGICLIQFKSDYLSIFFKSPCLSEVKSAS